MALAAPVQDVLTRMERRFVTASFIPTLVFVLAFTVTVGFALYSPSEFLGRWRRLGVAEQAALLGLLLLVSWFLASLLYANWRKIVRLYEGYPLKRLFNRMFPATNDQSKWLHMPGVVWHLNQQAPERATAGQLYARYPPPSHRHQTLPTTIGNILLSGELYALDRYGLDLNLLWPRLFWQLPKEVQQSLEIFKEEHQIPIALSFMGALFAVTAGATVVSVRGSWLLFVIVSTVGFVLCVGAYLLSIERTEEYAEQLRTTVDLYRRSLFENWRTGPRRFDDENEYFAAASAFVQSGDELELGGRELLSDRPTLPPPIVGGTRPQSISNAVIRSRFWKAAVHLIARGRLRRVALVAMIVWTIGGAFLLWGATPRGGSAQVRLLTLPVVPAIEPNAIEVGDVVDLSIRPCGRLVPAAKVVDISPQVSTVMTTPAAATTAVPTTSDGQMPAVRNSLIATFGIGIEQSRSLEGCSPDGATLLIPG